jgi:hypothetical protein
MPTIARKYRLQTPMKGEPNWVKLAEATTPQRPTWPNLDQFVQIAASPDRGTRLSKSAIVCTNTYKMQSTNCSNFTFVDVPKWRLNNQLQIVLPRSIA